MNQSSIIVLMKVLLHQCTATQTHTPFSFASGQRRGDRAYPLFWATQTSTSERTSVEKKSKGMTSERKIGMCDNRTIKQDLYFETKCDVLRADLRHTKKKTVSSSTPGLLCVLVGFSSLTSSLSPPCMLPMSRPPPLPMWGNNYSDKTAVACMLKLNLTI